MFEFIRNGMVNDRENIIMALYKSLMQPPLEYSVQYWSPPSQVRYYRTVVDSKNSNKMIKDREKL